MMAYPKALCRTSVSNDGASQNDLIKYHSFNYHCLCASNIEISTFDPYFFTELHASIVDCQHAISMWILRRHLKILSCKQKYLVFSLLKPAPLCVPHLSKKHHDLPSGSTPQEKGCLAVASARDIPHTVSCWLISGPALILQISTTISPPQATLPESTQSK